MLAFTVGSDPEIDLVLYRFDCIGSAAHARMLAKIGQLTETEAKKICGELKNLHLEAFHGTVVIPPSLEDCHTAIETALTSKLGELGKKIHTGRSRNDQVLLAMRLYLREELLGALTLLEECAKALDEKFTSDEALPMPGYTHLQPAMPSSVGMWLHSFYEGSLDLYKEGLRVFDFLDASPLGAASGFDVPLELDKKYVANLLGFSRAQRSSIEVQSSRGRHELRVLEWAASVGALFEKLAWDTVIFASSEFGFLTLPEALTTGSSIMPQKRNPDVAELLRSRNGAIRGAMEELRWVCGKLPSSYHRDLQLTKEPVVRGIGVLRDILSVVPLLIRGLTPNKDRLKEAMYPELFATYEVYRRVKNGESFRDAYKAISTVAKSDLLDSNAFEKEYSDVLSRVSCGMKDAKEEFSALRRNKNALGERVEAAEAKIFDL